MTNAPTSTLVFKNEAGDYFLLPQEILEQGRVPEEHKAEIEQAIAAAQADDVSGYRNRTELQRFLVTLTGGGFAGLGTLIYDGTHGTLGRGLH